MNINQLFEDVESAKLDAFDSDTPDNSWCGWVVANVPLLLTALEARQDMEGILRARITEAREQEQAAQQQLAEAQGTISSWQVENAELKSFITDLRAQLTASVELCNIREEQISELLKEFEASQAEVERLRRHPTPTGREPANNWRDKA